MDFLPISLSYLNKKLYNLITYKVHKNGNNWISYLYNFSYRSYFIYDSEYESDSVLLLILCPVLNSVVAVYELGKFLIYIDDRFLSKLNKPLIKLIKYKRK